MICSTCKAAKLTSEVHRVASKRTKAPVARDYWDAKGDYHHHDQNVTTCSYLCSHGHEWAEKVVERCGAPGCSWSNV